MSWPYLWNLLINPVVHNIEEYLDNYGGSLFIKDNSNLSWAASAENNYQQYFSSTTGSDKRKNIIVIFAESFEPKYSSAHSWIYNRLPWYDAIERDGISYSNFLAPGCVSEHAHISFLQWVFPLNYGDTFKNDWYQKYDGFVDSLPLFFDKNGYDTTFLSTANLSFLQQRKYLQEQWFVNIIGEEAFTWQKKYSFDAAPDSFLYNKAIEITQNKISNNKPFYLNLQTISTHTPRNSPYWTTEKSARKYADDQISLFYKQLRQTNFFDNGVLIIFGDHRVPLKNSEKEKATIWPLRPSRVLWTVISNNATGVSDMIVQPVDLHFSLKKLISSGEVSVWNYYNDVFSSTAHRDWWLHYCKYASNEVALMYTGYESILSYPLHPAYWFVKSFQSYQFKKNIAWQISSNHSWSWFHSHSGFLLIWHSWSPRYAPMNTMSGFIAALSQGADAIELDISFTNDNVNVVRHGPYPLNMSVDNPDVPFYRKKNCFGTKMISERVYKDMRKNCKIQNGEFILTFDEFVNLTKDIVPLYIVELKVYDLAKGLDQMNDAITIARKYNVQDKMIFISYDSVVRSALTEQDVRTARDMFSGDIYPSWEQNRNIEYIMTPFYDLTGSHLATILLYNKPIITYTPFTKDSIKTVISIKNRGLPLSGVLLDDIPLFLEILQ